MSSTTPSLLSLLMAYAVVVVVGREKQERGKNICHGTAKETAGLGCRGIQRSKQLTDKRATSLSIPWEAPKVDGAKRKKSEDGPDCK
jgi:hypothetical protein